MIQQEAEAAGLDEPDKDCNQKERIHSNLVHAVMQAVIALEKENAFL